MVNRAKQSLSLTLFLVSVEFFLVSLILLITESVFVMSGRTDHISMMTTLDTLYYSLLIAFYRIVWAGYPTTAVLIFFFSRRTDTGRWSLIRLTMASLAGYAVFRTGFLYVFDHSGLVALLQPAHPASALRAADYLFVAGIASATAPMLISRLSPNTVNRWLSRIGRAVALVIVLIIVDYIVLVAVTNGLEYASILLPDGSRGSEIGEDGWAKEIMLLLAVIIVIGIRSQCYTIAALLIVALDFTATRSRRASLAKLLTASFGSYLLTVVLLELQGVGWSLEFTTPWGTNFLYTIGITVILAPIVICCFARRIKWLSGILHGP